MTSLVLLVGFLGAGKTTYLRRLLPQLSQLGIEVHVIINDYQNASVDAELLQNLTEVIVTISGSCVCCGSRDKLLSALRDFDHQPGRVVIIETNGTTDSEELIELLSLAPELGQFAPPTQVSVIDGKRWQKRFWHNSLELDQAKTANHLFVSRTDEIDEKRLRKINESLRHHGLPEKHLDSIQMASLLAKLTNELQGISGRSDIARNQHGLREHHEHHDNGHDHGGEGHNHGEHNAAEHHFASFQIDLPEIVVRASLEKFLSGLPHTVIRAKGIVRLADSPDEYFVFQKVDRFESVQLFPVGKSVRQNHPVAVFIGPTIPEQEVRASAEKHLF
jgi:G3E family GTPase